MRISVVLPAPLAPIRPTISPAATVIETSLTAVRLLSALQEVEGRALRRRHVRWGARTLDLDLLLHGSRMVRTPALTVPHPELAARRFVLAPLAELCPACAVPGADATIAELLARSPEHEMRVVGIYPV